MNNEKTLKLDITGNVIKGSALFPIALDMR
jgi:hypothetical protein